ncbi:MAG: acyl-CoA dehydrogenase family protein, partial [Xanthobacteraceae bacterium]
MRAPDENTAYTLERLQERAAKLIPVLRERAIETTKERRIPEATIRDLWDADLFYLLKPKKFGGPAVRPDIAFQVADQLGRGDGSAAWIWSVMTIHDLFVALYPQEFQQEYWGRPNTLSASSFSPGGMATSEKGGFRLS